jgi:hypothetical protein
VSVASVLASSSSAAVNVSPDGRTYTASNIQNGN